MSHLVDYKTICAAVAGEEWAINKVVEHYAPEIERQCTSVVIDQDGRSQTVVDETLKEKVTKEFIEKIREFPINMEE